MHPILFHTDSFTIYTYGFCIAVGALLSLTYMAQQAKKKFNLPYEQSNNLFILLVLASVVGGKVFLFLENPEYYLNHFIELFSGSGFVFYGSFLFAVPSMLWFFKRNKIPALAMLDVMAFVTCIVHAFGRLGCFMAGCCYGLPTKSSFGVIFTDPVCQAYPLNTRLHPTQLYEAAFILLILIILFILKTKKQFDGQLFLLYLGLYAFGRAVLEIFRGDLSRGFVIQGYLSHSQFIALLILIVTLFFYVKLKGKANLNGR